MTRRHLVKKANNSNIRKRSTVKNVLQNLLDDKKPYFTRKKTIGRTAKPTAARASADSLLDSVRDIPDSNPVASKGRAQQAWEDLSDVEDE